MGRSWLFWALMCSVLLVAASSRSDVAGTTSTPILAEAPVTTDAVAEPTTGQPSAPATGDETLPKDPFSPYGVLPPPDPKAAAPSNPIWRYTDLSLAEKEVADRGRDVTGWDATHNAFAAAVALRAHDAAATSAASQLGVEDLATTGVVP